jgi:hypothetical protein
MQALAQNSLPWNTAIIVDATFLGRSSLYTENAKKFNHGPRIIGHQWTNIVLLIKYFQKIPGTKKTEISKSKLIKYKVKFSKREDRSQAFPKVTNTTPMQKRYFNMIGIRNLTSLEKFIW